MKEYTKKSQPTFPCLCLSIDNWNDPYIIHDIIKRDNLVYTRNKNEILNLKFVDSNGYTFDSIDVEYFSLWKKYIPFIPKGKAIFLSDGKKMSFIDVKDYMLHKIEYFPKNEMFSKIRNQIIISESYQELFNI